MQHKIARVKKLFTIITAPLLMLISSQLMFDLLILRRRSRHKKLFSLLQFFIVKNNFEKKILKDAMIEF